MVKQTQTQKKSKNSFTVGDVVILLLIAIFGLLCGSTGWLLHMNFGTTYPSDKIVHEGDMRYIIFQSGNSIQVVNYSIDSAKMENIKLTPFELWQKQSK
jgi:hypothetical protein